MAGEIMLKMKLKSVRLDVTTNQPVVILKDENRDRYLPIWIGQSEAQSILMEIEGIKPSRPLTHDLLTSVLVKLSAVVDGVVINDLKDGTYFAKIKVKVDSKLMEIDSRPSDAIAIAVRTDAPIFAEESVIEEAAILSSEGEEEEVKKFRDFLNEINPIDFGDVPTS